MGKMKDVAGHGRTILFVSHNMDAVKQLCDRAILLSSGKISYAGQKLDAVKEYQDKLSHDSMPVITGTKEIALKELKIKNGRNEEIHMFNTFDKVIFELLYNSNELLNNASFAVCFDDSNGTRIMSLWSSFQNKFFDVGKGEFKCVFEIEQIHLNPGVYTVVTYAESKGRVLERIDNYRYITVGYVDKYGLVKLPETMHGKYTENFNISMT
jgi:lipopolysaccharide transport system ATP-binding protein